MGAFAVGDRVAFGFGADLIPPIAVGTVARVTEVDGDFVRVDRFDGWLMNTRFRRDPVFSIGDRIQAKTEYGPQSIQAGVVFSVTAAHGEYVQLNGREGWYHSVRFERVEPPTEAKEGESEDEATAKLNALTRDAVRAHRWASGVLAEAKQVVFSDVRSDAIARGCTSLRNDVVQSVEEFFSGLTETVTQEAKQAGRETVAEWRKRFAKYAIDAEATEKLVREYRHSDEREVEEQDEPLILGDDDEPTECLDDAGCEVGPDVVNAIDRSEEKWQAIDVDGVTHLVIGATFAVALRDGCDRRNIDALVRRLNQPVRVNLQISDVGPEGLGPITAGFAD